MYERISFGFYSVEIDNPHDAKPIVDVFQLADALPHGSGLDTDYEIRVAKNGNIRIRTEYHAMSQSGMYAGWKPVNIFVFRHAKDVWHDLNKPGFRQKLHGTGDIDMYVRCDADIREMFNWEFWYALGRFMAPHLPGDNTFGPHGRPARFVNGEWQEEK